ncbi:MAG: hypothetical protein M1820_002512 [Bogoriella megaspora]|nr:MAG: hypothetical protein M1820_002512 [Bogoriella megaspora]
MSFLNQVLSSIGNGATSSPGLSATAPARPAVSRQKSLGNLNSETSRKPSESAATSLKRSADGDGEQAKKVPRTDRASIPDRTAARPIDTGKSTTTTTTSTTQYKGTARPSNAKPLNSKPTGSTSISSKPSTPGTTPPPTSASSAAPKRGYLATLEKAKAAQAAKVAAGVGTIKHKPVERVGKKDRLALKAEAHGRKKPGSVSDSKPSSAIRNGQNGLRSDDPSARKSKAPDLGYKGTMRPSTTSTTAVYKGTMRPSAPSSSLSTSRKPTATSKPQSKGRMAGYASYSEDDLREDEYDDEDDYGSDASSDMEAGMDDVYAEEQSSLRAARKEDEEALREENSLKRQKEERKKAALAAASAAARRRG